MKTEVKKLDNSQTEINVEVAGDVVKNKFEDVFTKISKEAKVSGFRPGNAPRDIIEKNFSSLAHQQVIEELVPDVYQEAIEKEKIDAIDLPKITDVKITRDTLSFKATVEIRPEIKLKNYKGLKVNYKKIEVSPDEVKRSLDSLKEARKIDSLDDNFARSVSYPNLEEFKGAIERQIFLQKENAQRQKIENEIIESLMQDLDFKLPQSLVNRQLEDMVRQSKLDLALRGIPKEKIDEEEKNITSHLESEARKQVKIYLILTQVAKQENIPIDQDMPRKVMEFLLKEADWQEIM
jgi:FKBP-type peptidyl-prolyl cis-trans isomerase (trigger factor)